MKKDNINRAVKIRALCPVVAITACKDKSVNEEAARVGISEVLYKPVNFRLLKRTLEEYYFRKTSNNSVVRE